MQSVHCYSDEYKTEALKLADKIGVGPAAKQLGLHESQLYGWRGKAVEIAQLKRQLAEQAEELTIQKKGVGVLCQKPEVKYAFMKKHAWEFSVNAMARVLDAPRSGFYAWRQRKDRPSPHQYCREVRDAEIKAVFEAGKGRNGAIRVTKDLADLSVKCNRKTVSDSLRRQGLRAKAARKFKATTNSKHNLSVAPNLFQQDFDAEHPNQKWVGDITYLWTDEGWLYLAVIIDLYSREVIGWVMSELMTATLVCEALRVALWRCKKPQGVIVHSDRGSQYCAKDYQKLIADHELLCSMGPRVTATTTPARKAPFIRSSRGDSWRAIFHPASHERSGF